MGSQLEAIRGEQQDATNSIRALEQEKAALQTELDEIKRKAANVLAVDNQNQILQQQVTAYEIQIGALEKENEDLSSKKMHNWFIVGALVLFGGVLLGLILPRMRWQRRSRYDSF